MCAVSDAKQIKTARRMKTSLLYQMMRVMHRTSKITQHRPMSSLNLSILHSIKFVARFSVGHAEQELEQSIS